MDAAPRRWRRTHRGLGPAFRLPRLRRGRRCREALSRIRSRWKGLFESRRANHAEATELERPPKRASVNVERRNHLGRRIDTNNESWNEARPSRHSRVRCPSRPPTLAMRRRMPRTTRPHHSWRSPGSRNGVRYVRRSAMPSVCIPAVYGWGPNDQRRTVTTRTPIPRLIVVIARVEGSAHLCRAICRA
jgi:hypothetical protein